MWPIERGQRRKPTRYKTPPFHNQKFRWFVLGMDPLTATASSLGERDMIFMAPVEREGGSYFVEEEGSVGDGEEVRFKG